METAKGSWNFIRNGIEEMNDDSRCGKTLDNFKSRVLNAKDGNDNGFLPDDVVENSGFSVQLIGKLTGEPNEIIVITQLGRSVETAYVCHLSNGYNKRNMGNSCKCILDMPGFPKIKITQDFLIKERDGIKYTMACIAEKDFDYARANWLY